MKLRDYPLLADENIHPNVVSRLAAEGHDVRSVRELNLTGADDRTLLRLAHTHRRVVLTHDSDFGMLAVVEREQFVGIVYLRPGHIDPAFTYATIQALFGQEVDIVAPFIVVAHRSGDRVKVRIRNMQPNDSS